MPFEEFQPSCPGDWLTVYRRRVADFPSPETLAKAIGVSGMTVRRWEKGGATPSESDLRLFARACQLEPIECEFLVQIFKAQEHEEPPDAQHFQSAAADILGDENPAVLFDSSFFSRVRNSYAESLIPDLAEKAAWPNLIQHLLTEHTDEPFDAMEIRTLQWFRRFWFASAHLCGSEAYRRVLVDLGTVDGFVARWRSMAQRPVEGSDAIGAPHVYTVAGIGKFRAVISRVVMPPVYYSVEYFASDKEALAWLQAQRDLGPARLRLNPRRHWALPEPGPRRTVSVTQVRDAFSSGIRFRR